MRTLTQWALFASVMGACVYFYGGLYFVLLQTYVRGL